MSAEARVHINYGGGAYVLRELFTCPVCTYIGARIVRHESGSPWYAPWWTCVECGDSWSEGELAARPFRRGWRAQAQSDALRDWESAPQLGTKVRRDWSEDGGGYITGYLYPWETDALSASAGGESRG